MRDFLIIGAGFAGLVAAQRLSQAGFSCVVVDRRSHVGGNAYDCEDSQGVLIHPYGPHYFRTNAPRIVEYLSQFTDWHAVDYQIKSFARGRYWSFPINLNTFEEWIGAAATEQEWQEWLQQQRVPIAEPRNSEEVIVSQVGWEMYRLFFEGYTLKQWKRHPRELHASVCGRIPIRLNRDDRYLSESFQALPKRGYTRMFESMIEASPGLEVHLQVEDEEARRRWPHRHLIYTGPIDAYFGRCFGALPYRSLRFELESFSAVELQQLQRQAVAGKPGFWQPALQVNYPEAETPHTRIVEIKHATGQQIDATAIMREYPLDWTEQQEPFYPIPTDASAALYERYRALALQEERVSFIGRLATYRYYNMDQVIGMALTEAEKLIRRYGHAASQTKNS